jgi:hypothetical protein
MEFIEEGIRSIESKFEETKTKQHQVLLDTITKTAKQIQGNCSRFDNQIRKSFPNCPEEPSNYDIFNPKRVVVIEDGKAVKTIDNWDTKEGILPNRYVKYDIRMVQTNNEEIGKAFDNIKIETFENTFSQLKCNCNHNYTCGCRCWNSQQILNNKKYNNHPINFNNNQNMNNFWIVNLHIDNYLNIYEPSNGLYIMFNKTPFPEFAFHSNHIFKDVYVSFNKCLFNNSKSGVIQSKDNEQKLLEHVNYLIPENYQTVYEYFNNTRKLFKTFETDTEKLNADNSVDKGIPEMDTKDMVIEGYKEKLEMYIRENQTIRDKILELEQLFIDKSNLVQDLERQIKYKEQELLEQKNKFEQSIIEQKETLEQERFKFKTEELNTDLLKQKFSTLMETSETATKQLRDYELKYQKIKDTNNGLLEKIKLIKSNLEASNEINSRYENEILNHKQSLTKMGSKVKENTQRVNELEKQNEVLEQRLLNSASTSTDALEQALQEQNSDLQSQIKEVKSQLHNMTKEKNKFEELVRKYKSTLQGLL